MENGEKKTVSRTVTDREVIMRKYHVHIKNFRNLKDVKVTLSPLTILTGENGSGKSTFFKALLFLKHNHTHEAAKKLKYVIDDDINLGGWDQIANDPKKPISIKITEETWGYDHQVEEIYDIDNCPFELNPTEEYAERLRSVITALPDIDLANTNFSKYIEQAYFGKTKPRFILKNRNIIKTKKLTASSSSHVYSYNAGALTQAKIGLDNDSFKFSIKYFHKGFDEESQYFIRGNDYAMRFEYYFVVEDAEQKNDKPIDVMGFFYALAMDSYRHITEQDSLTEIYSNIKRPIFGCDILSDDHDYAFEGPLVAWRIAKGDIFLFRQYNDIMTKFLNRSNFFPQLFNETTTITPTRDFPKSIYLKNELVNNSYYQTIDFFQEISLQTDFWKLDDLRRFQMRFEYWLAEFEAGRSLKIVETEETIMLMAQLLSGKIVSLSQLSSGSLQIIPIIFLLCSNKECGQFLIQQPELHLHPRLQSKLVDLFIDALCPARIETWEDTSNEMCMRFGEHEMIRDNLGDSCYQPRSENDLEFVNSSFPAPTSLVVETHSEHLLKKIQVLISQGRRLPLSSHGSLWLKDALSIYYFAKDAKGNTKSIELELDDNGFFKTETPKGFFDESLDLNRQLLLGRN